MEGFSKCRLRAAVSSASSASAISALSRIRSRGSRRSRAPAFDARGLEGRCRPADSRERRAVPALEACAAPGDQWTDRCRSARRKCSGSARGESGRREEDRIGWSSDPARVANEAARPNETHHLRDDLFGSWHIGENQARRREVERPVGKIQAASIRVEDLDVRQAASAAKCRARLTCSALRSTPTTLPVEPTRFESIPRQPRGPQPISTTRHPAQTPIWSNSHSDSGASSSACRSSVLAQLAGTQKIRIELAHLDAPDSSRIAAAQLEEEDLIDGLGSVATAFACSGGAKSFAGSTVRSRLANLMACLQA